MDRSEAKDNDRKVEVKICGITNLEDASACVKLGADALGFIFYPPSKRFVNVEKAKEIRWIIPQNVSVVGVFVNETPGTIIEVARKANLDYVQLHGQEDPRMVESLKKDGVRVIKALFGNREPGISLAHTYPAEAILVESSEASQHGGTGKTWKWSVVQDYDFHLPVILAGGLAPENVVEAINMAKPAAVDVSSGVEAEPGKKDLKKVEQFIQSAHSCYVTRWKRSIFR